MAAVLPYLKRWRRQTRLDGQDGDLLAGFVVGLGDRGGGGGGGGAKEKRKSRLHQCKKNTVDVII